MSLLSKIRVANTQRCVEAEVYPCSHEDMVIWQRRIHAPYIAPKGGIGSDWNWPALFLACQFSEQALARQAIAFQIRVANADGDAVPVAQAIFTLPYHWPADPAQSCVFVWFIAATPVEALRAYGIQDRFSVLAPLLDTAIQVSLSNGLGGRIGLHAAAGDSAAEGLALEQKYRNCQLRQASKNKGFFRFPFRRHDGRLFYFTDADAVAFAARQGDLR